MSNLPEVKPDSTPENEAKKWELSQDEFQELVKRQTNIESLLSQALAQSAAQTTTPMAAEATLPPAEETPQEAESLAIIESAPPEESAKGKRARRRKLKLTQKRK